MTDVLLTDSDKASGDQDASRTTGKAKESGHDLTPAAEIICWHFLQ
jgi:hypothetical protein